MHRRLVWSVATILVCVSCTPHAQAFGQQSRPVLTLPTDTRHALAAALHELVEALPKDTVPACLTLPGPAPAYWYSPEPQLLEELRTPAHRVVVPAQCPHTYDVMASVYIDNHNPVRPPGYIDPHNVDVDKYELVGADSVSVVVTAHQGTLKRHYSCSAHRDQHQAWRARCRYLGMSMA